MTYQTRKTSSSFALCLSSIIAILSYVSDSQAGTLCADGYQLPAWSCAMTTTQTVVDDHWENEMAANIVKLNALAVYLYDYEDIDTYEFFTIRWPYGGGKVISLSHMLRSRTNTNPLIAQCFVAQIFCPSININVNISGSPLLVDLGQNEFHLGPKGTGVRFDISHTGEKPLIQWVGQGTDDAFLVYDFNLNGVVDSGAELFGNASPLLVEEVVASNGFQALAQYDSLVLGGNEDGEITELDNIWSVLSLWVDANADAVTDPGELTPVSSSNLKSIPTTSKSNNRRDPAGNWIPLWNWVENDRSKGNRKHKIVDVFFESIEEDQ